jgi:spermidine/putrescine transport system ATP-binding protein
MIELRAITKRFGGVLAVDQVDLSVAAGEFLTLVGPSGCGKTTLLRILSGFERPDAGAVRIAGEDVTALPPYRRNLNQVFQSYALFPHLSVRENIGFGLRMQKTPAAERAARVAEAIALVELEGMEERRPDQLSGGQRQRVALARAIVPRPAVLLLDEPLSALDAKLRQQMQGELKRLQRRLGMTFVFVTHDRAEALAMGDRIAVMNRSRVEQVGPPAQVYARPQTAFVADFISEANLVRAERTGGVGEAARIRLACGGELTLAPGQWAGRNPTGRVSFRPEKISLARGGGGGDGSFSARVTELEFHGAAERVELRAGAESRLVALVSGQDPLAGALREGDEVWCRVAASDLVVLAD